MRAVFHSCSIALMLLGISGCTRMAMLVKPEPANAQVDAACYQPCDDPLDLQGDSGDELLAVAKVNRAFLVRCQVRHLACQQALERLKAAKVIE